ncbi:gliding motility-associated C-terminal domain-containing protein [Subsaxibacter sp. CAU 1640]|uniref:DUF7933 domain-containing protein n=1 Tax=Subsaxibacter sp. CAU 1640 TaxID=2933271 RepID=UPI002005B408|nr:gliding motility-associated C-terminal domain-containing protein [Subsaxibacter sp. CAU 1640]MCK7589422.1 gliding motility-associated C-terminal domain-containing protein [Subsaxibacter sp. CAU 1640]
MIKQIYLLVLFFMASAVVSSQTTDLAVVVEAQDLNGTGVSQVQIYQEFQYIITIINSGNTVTNSTFSQTLNQNVTVISYTSQNNSGGASDVTNITLNGTTLTGNIQNLPNTSSVQVKVVVKAPQVLGGIATSVSVSPPQGTQDANPSNNQSIISIDVVDVIIDFTVEHSQISPVQGTGISAWNDLVTYEFTITNNSIITYPLAGFSGNLELVTSADYGKPVVQLEAIQCIGGTNGVNCPDVSAVTGPQVILTSTQSVFTFGAQIDFPPNASLTFQITYRYLEPRCGIELQPMSVNSFVSIDLQHDNISSNDSNYVLTNLLMAELCEFTDICIQTIQTNPSVGTFINWNEEVTFETTVCNSGPLEAPIRFYLQNLSLGIPWDIISIECIGTTGAISCNDIILNDEGQFWNTNDFTMPVGATITIRSVIIFLEPGCSSTQNNNSGHVRSGTNILTTSIIDSNLNNNFESDYLTLPPGQPCPSTDLSVNKVQIEPILPEGGSDQEPTAWGPVTYEITVYNNGVLDTEIQLYDYIPQGANPLVEGALVSVECVSTTGTAQCFSLEHLYVGVLLDGVVENGLLDTFWEILPEDHWQLPAQSSVTFRVVVDWFPECSESAIPATNSVRVNHASASVTDPNSTNNRSTEITYFAPCVDLVVQTYPQFTAVFVDQAFDWIIDISNSATSSNAVNIDLESILDPNFVITGTPTCQIVTGNATCVNSFTVTGTTVTSTIPHMQANSSVRIRIPVTAPNFGGAFNNTANAFPNTEYNEELTPETNTSISNVQVIAPRLMKSFSPETIYVGEESTLTFTISNLASNPSQNNISFTDYLPAGLTLTGQPNWVNSNGCTATFLGVSGDDFVGVTDLVFPQGTATCSFSVTVTSNSVGQYINADENFSDQINIDTSQAFAVLNVIEDTTNVDIEVIKNVSPEEANLGDEVEFSITITNIGTTQATDVIIYDSLPMGYEYVNSIVSNGFYSIVNNEWSIPLLDANQSETLTVTAKIISSNNLLNSAFLQDLNEVDRDETNNEDSAEVMIGNCLKIPQGFSPTNDGMNDVFFIPCIENFPNNKLKIFNRLGVQVYEAQNYQNTWDGKANMGFPKISQRLPVGTYYYIMEIAEFPEAMVGWVYLNY